MYNFEHLTKDEKIAYAAQLEAEIEEHKKTHYYHSNMEQSLKLVLNQEYGAISNQYYLMFNNNVAGSITYCGRELIQKMGLYNNKYWYNMWHKDTYLHKKLYIKNVSQIDEKQAVGIYSDTDSVDSKTKIHILSNNINKTLTIEDWYNESIQNGSAGNTIIGHESVNTNDKILNYNDNGTLEYHNVGRIIRHKVTKPKWKIKTKSGKEIYITNDHSMIVFRDGIKNEVKPCEILKSDKILTIKDNLVDCFIIEYELAEIEVCEMVGDFTDEYVYDIEVDNITHTFIGNDILVHNSLFVSYNPAIKNCEWKNQVFNNGFLSNIDNNFMIITRDNKPLNDILPSGSPSVMVSYPLFKGYINYSNDISNEYITDILAKNNIYTLLIDGFYLKKKQLMNIIENHKNINVICNFEQELDFIHGLDYYRIAGYFKQCLDKHAAKYNVENVQEFELEKIADAVINIEKKRYVMNLVWEDGRYYDTLKNIQAKGFDIVRSSTPTFARGGKDKKEGVMKVINYLFQNPDSFDIKELLHIVKELRREMELLPIDDICAQSSCSNYNTKVIDDKTSIQCVTGTHFAVKAAAYHNYLLHNNVEYHNKYEPIRNNEKVKYYYCKDDGIGGAVFAYKRGSFPIEFAPPVDYDESFYRFVMSPVNALVTTIGLPEISKRLNIVMDLFSGL